MSGPVERRSLFFWSMPDEEDVPEVADRLSDMGAEVVSITDGGASDPCRFRVWARMPNEEHCSYGEQDRIKRSIEKYLKGQE